MKGVHERRAAGWALQSCHGSHQPTTMHLLHVAAVLCPPAVTLQPSHNTNCYAMYIGTSILLFNFELHTFSFTPGSGEIIILL